MSARIIRPGRWNRDGVAVPDDAMEMDSEIPLPPPIVRAPTMPPRPSRVESACDGLCWVLSVAAVAVIGAWLSSAWGLWK